MRTNVVSSAYEKILDSVHSPISAVRMMKIVGDRIAPWGDPIFVVNWLDIEAPIITICVLWERYDLNHSLLF